MENTVKRGNLNRAAMNNDLKETGCSMYPPDATAVDAFRLGEGTPCKDIDSIGERSTVNAVSRVGCGCCTTYDTRNVSKFGGSSTHSIRIHNMEEDEENAYYTMEESGVEVSFTFVAKDER